MKVYAIYSPRFNKYYNYLTANLDDLGSGTKLYSNEINAMRKIKGIRLDGYDRLIDTLDVELAWKYIEHHYQQDRWSIDISNKEFLDICMLFKDLKVVPIELSAED